MKAEASPEEFDPADPGQRARAEAEIIGCSDAILATCSVELDQLVELYGADPSRVEIVAPGVDHAFFSPGDRGQARRALGLADSGPLLLFVGRIQPLKGSDVAIRTLAALPRLGVDRARLAVVGGPSGPRGDEEVGMLRALVTELGLGDRVTFVEPQPHERLSTYYRAADVCLVPSRSESFGLVALEAAACGTPVVASAVGGLTTLVDDGETGFLVEDRGADVFAEHVAEIVTRPGLAAAPRRGGGAASPGLHLVVRRGPPAPALQRPDGAHARRVRLRSQVVGVRLCVVGGGRMGTALVAGLLGARWATAGEIAVAERVDGARDALRSRFPGLLVAAEPVAADGVIVAVKPHDAEAVCRSLRGLGYRRALSIAAGVTTGSLVEWLGDGVATVRAMPNTPAQLGAGVSILVGGGNAGEADLDWAEGVLRRSAPSSGCPRSWSTPPRRCRVAVPPTSSTSPNRSSRPASPPASAPGSPASSSTRRCSGRRGCSSRRDGPPRCCVRRSPRPAGRPRRRSTCSRRAPCAPPSPAPSPRRRCVPASSARRLPSRDKSPGDEQARQDPFPLFHTSPAGLQSCRRRGVIELSIQYTKSQFLTVGEVAHMLRISNMTVYRLISSGQLPAVRVGKSYRLREEDVDGYLAARFTEAV